MTRKKIYIRLSISILLIILSIIFYALGVSNLQLVWSKIGFIIGAVLSMSFTISSIYAIRHKEESGHQNFVTKHRYELLDWATFLSISLMSIFMVFMFFLLPSDVSQTSMYPTFSDGDRILIYHFNYKIKRDDVVAIRMTGKKYPRVLLDNDKETYFVKRVVGMPGDEITFEYAFGSMYVIKINGDTYINQYGETYLIREYQKEALEKDLVDHIVPSRMAIVFGDNQEGSQDSRSFGPVYIDDVMGKVIYRIYPPGGVK